MGCKQEVWYYPDADQFLMAIVLSKKARLMFFEAHKYYYNPWSVKYAKAIGAIRLGPL